MQIVIKGRKVVKGIAEGEALVSNHMISFLGTIDKNTGVVVETEHDLIGKCVAGKILVYPSGKGSIGSSFRLYDLASRGLGPAGIINYKADSVTVGAAVIAEIPLIDSLSKDSLATIKTGDFVKMNGNKGIVEIIRSKKDATSK